MFDSLLHGNIGIGSRVAHKALDLAVDVGVEIDINTAGNMATHAHVDIFLLEFNTGAALFK